MELTQEQKGKIGETAVMLELLKKGFNVININNSYPNYKNADLICMNANNGKSVMIQVKTGTTHNILTGFTSELDGTIQKLEESIIGPWVFVYMPDDKMSNMEFYILDVVLSLLMIPLPTNLRKHLRGISSSTCDNIRLRTICCWNK